MTLLVTKTKVDRDMRDYLTLDPQDNNTSHSQPNSALLLSSNAYLLISGQLKTRSNY